MRLLALANRAVSPSTGHGEAEQARFSSKVLKASLLDAAAQLVIGDNGKRQESSPRQRHQTCCRAIAHSERLREPISVPELASAVDAWITHLTESCARPASRSGR